MTRRRRQFAIAVLVLFLAFVPSMGYSAFAPGSEAIPILVYHRFDPDHAGPTTVRTATFEAQLTWLADHHYRVIPLHAAIDLLGGNHGPADSPAVVITADDGHRSVYTEMFPVIQRRRVPVTLFIYPSAISNASYALTWEELRAMQASGLVDVQSHTYWHPNFRTERARLSAGEYQSFVAFQLARSKQVLEKRLGSKVDAIAWPFGIYDPQLEAAASHAGYAAAFAFAGGPARAGCDMLAIPRIPVPDTAQGVRFAALLDSSAAREAKNQ